MLECCQSTLKTMQDIEGLSTMLEFYLKASPYAVLVPELASGLLTEGVKETAKGYVKDMLIDKALGRLNGSDRLPDVKAAIESAEKIKIMRLQDFAKMHSLAPRFPKHSGREIQFWNKMVEFYNPENVTGGSWFGWF